MSGNDQIIPIANQNNNNNPDNFKFTVRLKDFELNNCNSCCCKKKYIIKNCPTMYNSILYLELTNMEKDILLCRLKRICSKIRKHQIYHKVFYNISKTFIIIASILSPALTSLNTDTNSTIYLYLWWIVWLLQLGISLIASLSSFLKWDHKYFLFSKYKNKIEQEIWNYLETNEEYYKNLESSGEIQNKHKFNLKLFFKRLEHSNKMLYNKDNEISLNDDISGKKPNNQNLNTETGTETGTGTEPNISDSEN